MEVSAPAAADLHGFEELRGVEAGTVDDDVEVPGRAVRRDNPGLGDLGDGVGNKRDVVALEGCHPDPIVQERALAAHGIGGDDLLDQIGPVRGLGGDRAGDHLPEPEIYRGHRG